MEYFVLEPEVAGELGPETQADASVYPPRVSRLHYEVVGWHGDELLESFPCYLVSDALAARLSQAGLGVFELRPVQLTLTPEAEELFAGKQFPDFLWLHVTGKAGQDDLGVTALGQLVVVTHALEIFQQGTLNNCDIEKYVA